jgi:hypothetical protein
VAVEVAAGAVVPRLDKVFELRDEPRVPPKSEVPVVPEPAPSPVEPKLNGFVVVVGVDVVVDKGFEAPSPDPSVELPNNEVPVLCVVEPKFNAGVAVVVVVVAAGAAVVDVLEAPKVVPPNVDPPKVDVPKVDPDDPNKPPPVPVPPRVPVEPKLSVGAAVAAPVVDGVPGAGVVVAGLFKLNVNGDDEPKFISESN